MIKYNRHLGVVNCDSYKLVMDHFFIASISIIKLNLFTTSNMSNIGEIISDRLRQYCCPYDESVFFYANDTSFECGYDGNIMGV